MLKDINDLRIFERIVARGSLSAAARELGLSLAVVSKRLGELERQLDARLLHRTTRRLSLTEEGDILHQHCLRLLSQVDEAEAALLHHHDSVTGTLHLTAPTGFGRRHLVPALSRFTREYPELRVQLALTDTVEDLAKGGFDLAIRYGEPLDSRMVARRLAPNRRVLCASPDYLQRKGAPRKLADLTDHDCILIGQQPQADWYFGRGQRESAVRITGAFCCNDGEAAHALALQGAGIVLKSIWDVGEDLQCGRLVQVLPRHTPAAAPLNALYLHGRHLAPRVTLFLDFLKQYLHAHPQSSRAK